MIRKDIFLDDNLPDDVAQILSCENGRFVDYLEAITLIEDLKLKNAGLVEALMQLKAADARQMPVDDTNEFIGRILRAYGHE